MPDPIQTAAPLTHTPELLSPAGNWECARAAVANGADAIYFGLARFNARLRADNFTGQDLPGLMAFLHGHGVKGYAAFNTLVFTGELADAVQQLRVIADAGVDAVIVQDLGLARLVKALTPGVRLHASTQMTLTSPEGLAFARRLRIDQAVLARELSLRELERFQAGAMPDLPLEVFVHGALCVAYSGQCLTSESLGRRSANRGECAQACRLPYQIIVDGVKQDLGDRRYLLSPQDLAALDDIPRLIELGIRSFKIEGRLKSPEYVAAVTAVYRKAIDAALAGRDARAEVDAADRYSLEMTFSRGLYSGWMHGVNHQELVPARSGTKRGAFVGLVTRVGPDHVEIDPPRVPLKPGDGVVFENPADTDHEQGGRLWAARDGRLEFQHGKIQFAAIQTGTRVFKTDDPALNRRLRQSFSGEIPLRKRRALRLTVRGRPGEPLEVSCGGAVVCSAMPLQQAQKRPLDLAQFTAQFGRLGDTAYALGEIDFQVEGQAMLPVSELNRMRRALVAELEQNLSPPQPPQTEAPALASLESMLQAIQARAAQDAATPAAPTLAVLCRTFEQIDAALAAGVERLYVDFEDIRQYGDAVRRVRDHGGAEVLLATPRIQKSGETGFFKSIARAMPNGVLIRNLGGIDFYKGACPLLVGDFSLNAANPLTAELLIDAGLQRLTVSYDLTAEQALDLVAAAPRQWFELTLHQHMPMFHMEHCAFAAFLSEGTDFTNCGRPCEKHRVHLRDRVGMDHPLKADVGCRNTLFNAVPQTGAAFYDRFHAAGLRHYRVELLEENAAETARVIQVYQDLLAGRRGGDEVWRDLKAQSKLGVTRGTLSELEPK